MALEPQFSRKIECNVTYPEWESTENSLLNLQSKLETLKMKLKTMPIIGCYGIWDIIQS